MNSVSGTTDPGIDLYNVDANDGALTSADPNEGIDHPIITNANLIGGNLNLTGYVGIAPNDADFANARVEFFVSDGGGEGRTYLGFLTTDANGNYSGTLSVTGVIDTDSIVATATITGIGTSEFGNEFGVNVAPINTVPGNQSVNEDTSIGISGVSIADSDSNIATVQLSVGDGVISATLQAAATFSAGSSGSSTFTLSGSAADINATLATLSYQGNLNFNGNDTLTVLTTDDGGLADSDNFDIVVDAVNDDPLNGGSVPSDITVTEDVSSNIDLSSVSIQDVDDAGSPMTVRLTTSTGGNLTAAASAGITIGTNGTGQITLTSTLGALNAYLDNASNIQYLHGTPNTFGNDADTILVEVSDNGNSGSGGGGFVTFGTSNIDITNANDAPVITGGPDTSSLAETDSGLTDSGTLTVSDVDQADTVTTAVDSVAVTGTGSSSVPPALDNPTLRGFLTVSPTAILDGTETTDTLTWDFNSGSEAFDFLADGETLILTYTVSATDDAGTPLSDTETVTITITGTNDTPTVTVVDVGGAVTEDASTPNLTDSGSVTFAELDETDVVTSSVALANTATTGSVIPGSLSTALNSALSLTQTGTNDGSITWNFNVANTEVQYLADGETVTATYTITVTDDSGTGTDTATQDVTVVITGTNDTPTITVVDVTGAVTEDASIPNLTDSGSIIFTEVDDTDLLNSSVALTNTATTGPAVSAGLSSALSNALSLTQTGTNDGSIAWDFTVANSLTQYLADGETVTATYTITVTDDSGTGNGTTTQDVTVVITGTNDTPTITVVDVVGAVTEDASTPNLSDSGSITFGEVDDTDLVNSSVVLTNTVTTGPAVPAGFATALSSALSLTQTGTNDGSITWDFSVANSLTQYLAEGETVTVTYTVTVADDSGTGTNSATQDITITITGTNDSPTITGGPDSVSLTETNAGLSDSDTLTVSDADTTDIVTAAVDSVVVSGTGTGSVPGSLDNATLQSFLSVSPTTILGAADNSATLTWNFNSGGEPFDFLATGETLVLTYAISTTDDGGSPLSDTQTVTVTITGTNDGPQATNLNAPETYTEDTTLDLTDIIITDSDHDNLTVTLTLSDVAAGTLNTGTSGSVTSTFTAGVWTASGTTADLNALLSGLTFTPEANYNLDFNIAVSIDDGEATPTSGIKTFTAIPVNDAPTDVSPDALAVDENIDTTGGYSIGTLSTTDVDSVDPTEFFTYSILPAGDGAFFSIGGPGNDQLLIDDGVIDFETKPSYTVTVRGTDSGGEFVDQTIVVSVNDLNDTPTVTLTNVLLDLPENTDTSAPIKVADIVVSDDALGTNDLTLSGADLAAFEIVGAELFLRAGVTLDFETQSSYDVIVNVDDAMVGLSPDDTASYSLAITDLDDSAPVIQPGQIFSIPENSAIGTLLGSLIATDADTTGPLTDWTLLSGNADGNFQLTNADGELLVADFTNLNFEQNQTYTLTLTVSDGTQISAPETITVQVLNVNDRPVATGEQLVTDQTQGILVSAPGVLANDIDEDGDALTSSLVSGPANGALSLDANGAFTYVPNADFFGTDSFVYVTNDGLVNSAPVTVEIIVLPLSPSGPSTTPPTNPPTIEVTPIPVTPPTTPTLDIEVAGPTGGPAQSNDNNRNNHTSREVAGETFVVQEEQGEDDQEEAVLINQERSESKRFYANAIQKQFGVTVGTNFEISIAGSQLSIFQFSGENGADTDPEVSMQQLLTGTTAVASTALSVGYVVWLIRGGSLLASLVSALPAWTAFDPLALVNQAEKEDAESLVDIVSGDK